MSNFQFRMFIKFAKILTWSGPCADLGVLVSWTGINVPVIWLRELGFKV
jgi:hypothetical protein